MKLIFTSIFITNIAMASSLTIRDIQLKSNQIEIKLDGEVSKNAVSLDFVRDNVQLSLSNATIYPAKILHADSQSFNKIFAYQYSPNLVRVRLSVEGQALAFKDKIKWSQNGKNLIITFPEVKEQVKLAARDEVIRDNVFEEQNEKKLIEKVIKKSEENGIKNEQTKEEPAKAETSKKLTGSGNAKATSSKKLAGASSGPSGLRSLLAIGLVVGGLGLVLLYLKKKKGLQGSRTGQARRVGNSWFNNAFGNNAKSLIEVMATHSIGPKQNITIVKIKGQQFVLAVTEGNVQLITQLDSDAESDELELLDNPSVAASIGKMFGAAPKVTPVETVSMGTSFESLLKRSDGAGAIVARNAYAAANATQSSPAQNVNEPPISRLTTAPVTSARDQIKKRLEGMRNS